MTAEEYRNYLETDFDDVDLKELNRSEVLDKEGYMEELEKTTSRISEITLQIAELENEIAVAKKKCDEATEKNEIKKKQT